MKLHPVQECMKRADELIARYGAEVYQQFNCAKCGSKQTMSVPNTFFARGLCEKCGAETNIEASGCNYLVHFTVPASRRK